MTRQEYNTIRSIKKNVRIMGKPVVGCMYTIKVNSSVDFKEKLHDYYMNELNLHPAAVKIDRHYFDENERIIYIVGQTWKDESGRDRSWKELYTMEQKEEFDRALHC